MNDVAEPPVKAKGATITVEIIRTPMTAEKARLRARAVEILLETTFVDVDGRLRSTL